MPKSDFSFMISTDYLGTVYTTSQRSNLFSRVSVIYNKKEFSTLRKERPNLAVSPARYYAFTITHEFSYQTLSMSEFRRG
jgi:hypothetical protein